MSPYFYPRIENQIRCWWSYVCALFGAQRIKHMPVFISVEPADFCQLACPECAVGQRQTSGNRHTPHVLTIEQFDTILAQTERYVHTMQFFFQGEPLLNPHLPEMISKAHAKGIYTIVSTNAQNITPELAQRLVQSGLNRIIVSMDGLTQETYEQYRRGGSIDKVKQAIKALKQAKDEQYGHLIIELQCLMLRSNEHEWAQLKRSYRALGADVLTLKTAQLTHFAQGNPLMPSNTRYARYKRDHNSGIYVIKRAMRRRCYRLWSGCVIDAQGNVLPCCYDKQAQHAFGNIFDPQTPSLEHIWHGERATRFRSTLMRQRSGITICTNCNE